MTTEGSPSVVLCWGCRSSDWDPRPVYYKETGTLAFDLGDCCWPVLGEAFTREGKDEAQDRATLS